MPINSKQWNKLAEILEVPLDEIIEYDDKQVFICKDNATQQNYGTNNNYTIPESLLEIHIEYITKLKEEIAALKEENTTLKRYSDQK